MGKKIIKIDGKVFLVDSATKQMEEVETEEEVIDEKKEEVEEKEEEEETEDAVDAKIAKAAKKAIANLGLDGLHESLKEIQNTLSKKEDKNGNVNALLDLEHLMKKGVDKMTVREKITGFYQAMIQSNHGVLKALSEGTAADGGYLFPDEFRAEIIRDLSEGNYMRNQVTVVPMKRDVMKIPSLESRPKVTWTNENDTKATTTAHFNEETLTVKKMAAILYASDELVEDSTEIDVVDFIIGLFSEVIGEEEDRVIWRGNGTTQPTGVSTARAAGTIATRTATAGLTFDAIIELIYDLPAKYHKNARLYAHRHNIRDMRKLKDSNNRYYWQEPVAAGQPALFYGYPVIEANDLPSDEIYFGDMKKGYWLGDRQRMTVKISQDTETAFTKDQTAIRIVSRIAGNVVLPEALRCLNGI